MSNYAIAVVRDKLKNICLRVFNKETGTCINILQNEIPYYISRYGIENISIGKRGAIKWEHGSADRYPIIDEITGEIRNKNNIIILGASTKSTPKKYLILNYLGDTTIIEGDRLLEYCKTYKMANAKVVQKDGQSFISGIGWSISELNDRPIFKFYPEGHFLEIEMPIMQTDTLLIPNMTSTGRLIEKVHSIKITPQYTAYKIKKLIMDDRIHDITFGVLSSMPNLEEVEIKSKQALIYDSAFVSLKRLKRVKIGGVKSGGASAFMQLKELESVECEIPMRCIYSQEFRGCSKLDISTVLREGVEILLGYSFSYMNNLKHVTLPSTLVYMDRNVFAGSDKIETVECLTDSLDVGFRRSYTANSDEVIFKGNPNKITMYVGKHMRLNGKAGANVEVVVRDETEQDRLIDKRIRKGNMIGLNIDTHVKLRNPSEVANIIALSKPSEIKQMVDSMIQSAFQYKKVRHQFNLNGSKIEIVLPIEAWIKAKSIKDIGKAYVLRSNLLTIIPYDPKIVKTALEKSDILKLSGTGIKFYKTLDMRDSGIATLTTPTVEARHVKSVEVGDNGLIRVLYAIPGSRVKVVDIHDFET